MMASMLRKMGLSSRESSQERNVPQKDAMKLNMQRSPLFARRTSHDSRMDPNGRLRSPGEPLPDVLHGSTGVQRARVQQAGLSLDLHCSTPQSGYSASGMYEPVQRRNRDSDASSKRERSFGSDVGRSSADFCMSPLTPITPLSPNSQGSPFLPRKNARPVAFATPQLSRKPSNAVVFDSAQSMMQGNAGIDESAIAFEVVHSPRKVVARSLSSTPHPPVTPTEYGSSRGFSAESPGPPGSTSGSLSSLSQYEDLSISGISSVLSRSDSTDRDSDHTYQTVNKSNRSSGTGSNSSMYISPVHTNDERRKMTTSRPPNLPTGLLARKDSLRSVPFRPGLNAEHHPASGTSSHPPSQGDIASLAEDLRNVKSSMNCWSDRNVKRYTQFIDRNCAALSMLPQEEILQLFREQFTKHINPEDTLPEEPPNFLPPPLKKGTAKGMSVESMVCTRCGDGFEPQEKIVNSNGQLWHTQCFVCAQCFRAFPDDIFYEFEGRRYCEHDFQVLFAPCCAHCNEFIIGRVIKAMNSNWHPQCFRCNECQKELADLGFIRYMGRAVCHDCNARLKAQNNSHYMCQKCHSVIDGEPLRWRGDTYHPYHFNCANCDAELTHQAREVKSRPGYTANQMNQLYCLRCHDKMGIPICGACRRPIEERVVTALGKHWHVEHFVCIKCEKPFFGNRHYEKKGQAYCETHYHELFGNLCFVCNQVIYGDVVTALNKAWCLHHFACSHCDVKMTQKTKFFEFDQKPICKKCYEKLPQELKKRLKRHHDTQARGGKPAAV